ncbi:GNAT family N-acetyltransferase [Streptomyces sp. NPDC021356]|uniref:GNAT family N-acetyltransferase n=1 Tax=Streptomyces sp. NPDC021356 TaxID=3154900 RepID=UPI0033D33904
MTQQERFAVRRPGDVPLENLVDLVRSYEEHITGVAGCTREDILLEAGHPGYEENGWCLTGPGGQVFGWAALTAHGTTLDAALTVRPGRHAESAARTLLARLLDRADELGAEQGRPYALTVGGVLSGDEVVPSILQEAGFAPGTSASQYTIDLTAPPLPPVLPEGGSIRQTGPDDLGALHTVHLNSRGNSPKTEDPALFGARLRRLQDAGGAALLMEVTGRPTGYVLTRAVDGKEGRVLELAVAPALRGLGIEYALLTAGLAELRAVGVTRARVLLDTGDLHDPESLGRVLTVQAAHTVTRFHRAGD